MGIHFHKATSLKKILSFVSLFLLFAVYGQKEEPERIFHVRGRIEHFGNGILLGSIRDPKTDMVVMDTIPIENDFFDHSSRIKNKQIVRYVAGGNRFSVYRKVVKDGDSVEVDFADKRLKAIEVVAFPGADIRINGTASTILAGYPSGDTENNLLGAMNRQMDPLFRDMSHLDYTNKKNIRQVLDQEERLLDSIYKLENRCFREHPGSMVSSYLMEDRFGQLLKTNPEKADSLLGLLRPQNNDIYYRNMVSLRQNRSKKDQLKTGDIFPDFISMHSYDGGKFNLNDTKGKYRLIDFWGSWCIPCIREMPGLKEFAEKHKTQLVVIGIANDTYERWKTFLDKKTYHWIQLIDLAPDKLADKINIEVYPTKYLLDPNGKILFIVKDADQTIWNRIEEVLKDSLI